MLWLLFALTCSMFCHDVVRLIAFEYMAVVPHSSVVLANVLLINIAINPLLVPLFVQFNNALLFVWFTGTVIFGLACVGGLLMSMLVLYSNFNMPELSAQFASEAFMFIVLVSVWF